MDLIPGDFRRLRRTRYYLRAVGAACALLAVFCALGWLGLQALIASEEQKIEQLRRQDGQFQVDQSKVAEMRQKKQLIEDQLGALSRLRAGEQVESLLRAIDAAHTPGIWFESIQLHHPANETAGAALAKVLPGALRAMGGVPSAASAKTGAGGSVNIIGHAIDHTRLAEFMRKLGEQSGMARLYLIDTKPRSYAEVEAIDFALAMQLDVQGAGAK